MFNIIDKTTPSHAGLNDNSPKYIVVHHAASGTGFTVDDCINFHVEKRGWEWGGYTYFIEWDGSVYQMRPDTTHGAHAPGYNKKSIGICLAGNFDLMKPSRKQESSLRQLILFIQNKYSIPTEKIILHRDTKDTACPGKNITSEYIHTLLLQTNPLAEYSTAELLIEVVRRLRS